MIVVEATCFLWNWWSPCPWSHRSMPMSWDKKFTQVWGIVHGCCGSSRPISTLRRCFFLLWVYWMCHWVNRDSCIPIQGLTWLYKTESLLSWTLNIWTYLNLWHSASDFPCMGPGRALVPRAQTWHDVTVGHSSWLPSRWTGSWWPHLDLCAEHGKGLALRLVLPGGGFD